MEIQGDFLGCSLPGSLENWVLFFALSYLFTLDATEKEIELVGLWDSLEKANFKGLFFHFSQKAKQTCIIKSLVQKFLLFSCLQQLNQIYFETSAYKSDCPKGIKRVGLIIVLVQFLDKGLLYLTSVFFLFCFLSFFLGSGYKMTALQINSDLIFMVRAHYA